MVGKYCGAVLKIDLKQLSENYLIISNKLKNGAKAGAVVKDNAYCMGFTKVVDVLIQNGCNDFFVTNIDQGLEFCEYYQGKNVYILHGIKHKDLAPIYREHNLIPVLNDDYQIKIWNEYGREQGIKLPSVIHIDTGMGRLGISQGMINKIKADDSLIEFLDIKYIMSHLACANDPGHVLNTEQLKLIQEYSRVFHTAKISFANSSGVFLGADYHFDLVRPGCALYGINPTPYQQNPMHEVITLKADIIQKRVMEHHHNISYGATYRAQLGSKILTIECGYADGYIRALGNKARCHALGYYMPIVGNVTMDMIMADASQVPEEIFAKMDCVELIGSGITVDEVAEHAGTTAYEVLVSLGSKVKKEYI